MNRRTFLQQSGRALAAAPVYSLASGLFAGSVVEAAVQNIPPGVLSRIGITTVCFRERFAKSRSRGAAPPPGGDLTLLTAPKFIADNLGLHNVEIWNYQFDDTSLDYCKKIKAAADAAGSKITDLQLDLGPDDNLSDPDATKRAASIKTIKEWMDPPRRAVRRACAPTRAPDPSLHGIPSVRPTGSGSWRSTARRSAS